MIKSKIVFLAAALYLTVQFGFVSAVYAGTKPTCPVPASSLIKVTEETKAKTKSSVCMAIFKFGTTAQGFSPGVVASVPSGIHHVTPNPAYCVSSAPPLPIQNAAINFVNSSTSNNTLFCNYTANVEYMASPHAFTIQIGLTPL